MPQMGSNFLHPAPPARPLGHIGHALALVRIVHRPDGRILRATCSCEAFETRGTCSDIWVASLLYVTIRRLGAVPQNGIALFLEVAADECV